MAFRLTFFETLLLGHLVGDYLFQNNWMAQRKGAHLLPCVVHCVFYTLTVCVFTSGSPWWAACVFLSHFPVDRWSLADKWLRLIGGRSITEYLENGHEGVPAFESSRQRDNYVVLRGGFSSLVYAVADNTLHLLLMVLAAWSLTKVGML